MLYPYDEFGMVGMCLHGLFHWMLHVRRTKQYNHLQAFEILITRNLNKYDTWGPDDLCIQLSPFHTRHLLRLQKPLIPTACHAYQATWDFWSFQKHLSSLHDIGKIKSSINFDRVPRACIPSPQGLVWERISLVRLLSELTQLGSASREPSMFRLSSARRGDSRSAMHQRELLIVLREQQK